MNVNRLGCARLYQSGLGCYIPPADYLPQSADVQRWLRLLCCTKRVGRNSSARFLRAVQDCPQARARGEDNGHVRAVCQRWHCAGHSGGGTGLNHTKPRGGGWGTAQHNLPTGSKGHGHSPRQGRTRSVHCSSATAKTELKAHQGEGGTAPSCVETAELDTVTRSHG